MDIKELLGEELFKQVKEKIGSKELIINDGNFIPRQRFNEVNDELKTTKEKVVSYEGQLAKTKDLIKDNEEFKTKYSELEDKFKVEVQNKDKEISNITKRSMVKEKLITSGAKHVSLLMKEIDLEAIELDKDNLKGFDDVLGKLKTDYDDLFIKSSNKGTPSEGDSSKSKTTGKPGEEDWEAKLMKYVK
jgi:hypothetical protein